MRILFAHLGREQIGIEYLSSILTRAGHETHLAVDVGLFGLNDNIFHVPRLERMFSLKGAVIEKFRRLAPDLVCLSAYTGTLQWCFSVAEEMKKIRDATILIGGIHVTLEPEASLGCPAVDFGVRGEAESVILQIVDTLERGGDPSGIPGVVSRAGGRTVANGVAPLVADIDEIPFPDKRLFEHSLTISHDYMAIPARGCPYQCAYCCEHAVKEALGGAAGYYRLRSVDNVMEELLVMKSKYRYTEVFFGSPVFPTSKKWGAEFLARYRKEIAVPFWGFAHVNHIDEEYARMLKAAGCFKLEFGVQSVNQNLRRDVLCRRETNDTISKSFSGMDAAGLSYDVGHLFNLPGETETDYIDAVRFYARFKRLQRVKIYLLTLFPGARIVDEALSRGLIDEEARDAVRRGEAGDYFHIASTPGALPEWKKKAYAGLLSLLPIVPKKWLLGFLAPRRLAAAAKLPSAVVRTIEMLHLVAVRDPRLKIYFKLYLRHFTLLATGRRKA